MTQTTLPTPRVFIPIFKDGKSYMVAENPHREYDEFCVDQDIQWSKNPRWEDFDKSNPPIPCIDGFTPEDREYSEDEVEVVWQFFAPNQLHPEWKECDPNEDWREEFCRRNGCQTRKAIHPKHPTQQEINKMAEPGDDDEGPFALYDDVIEYRKTHPGKPIEPTFTRTEVISIVDAVLKRVAEEKIVYMLHRRVAREILSIRYLDLLTKTK